jgi:aspartate aminotransferase
MFLLQLVYYGDLVIPTPSWVSYAPQARIIGRQVALVDTRREDDWRLTPEELDRALRERPGPTAHPDPQLPEQPHRRHLRCSRARGSRAGRAHDTASSAVRRDLRRAASPRAHVSIARFYPEGTIVSAG